MKNLACHSTLAHLFHSLSAKAISIVVALPTASIMVAAAQNPTPLLTQPEEKLIAVLKSDAGQKEKADACRELAVLGTKKAVPDLATLLADEKLSHMARYALETIPDPSATDALRDAVGKLKGPPLVGVIGSLGVRRDVKAVDHLAKLLTDEDADVAQGAARALGSIGNSSAARALTDAMGKIPPANQVAFCEGLFRCAEALTANGQNGEALAIYDRLRALPDAPHQVRAGALRGAVLGRQKGGLPQLLEAVRSDDWVVVDAAARIAMEMPGGDVTRTLIAELDKLPAAKQVLFIQVLGKRADPVALPNLSALAKGGTKLARIAAIRALPEIGQPSVVPVLAELMTDAETEIAEAAQESLAALPGPEADAAVMTMLNSLETPRRLKAIDLIGRRRMTSRIPALLAAATDPEPSIRPAALRKVGELGGPAELSALLGCLMKYKEPRDLDAAEQALSTVCTKADKPESCADMLIAGLAQAQPSQKSRLMSVLAAVGGESALKTVRAAVNDPNADVHAAAIRALSSWKTADAAPALLALAETATNPTDRMLCLRGYLDWASRTDLPADRRLAMCQEVRRLVQQPEEKKLLLGALGSIKTARSLALVAPYLEDPTVREEATAATIATAEAILKGPEAAQLATELIQPLQKAAEVAADTNLGRRAKALLEQAQNKAAGTR
jgi:HEAT repeat protein